MAYSTNPQRVSVFWRERVNLVSKTTPFYRVPYTHTSKNNSNGYDSSVGVSGNDSGRKEAIVMISNKESDRNVQIQKIKPIQSINKWRSGIA